MARVKLGVAVVGISGTIGGITFAENKAGPYAKSWRKGINPGTPDQFTQRGFMAQMSTLWRSLSTAQQAAWDTFAAAPPEIDYDPFGVQYYLSGWQWMCRISVRLLRVGLTPTGICPANVPTAAPLTFTLTLYPCDGDDADAIIGYTNGDFTGFYVICEASQAPGQGTNNQTSRYLKMYEALQQAATFSLCGLKMQEKFGTTQVAQRFFARLYKQSTTGIRSTPLSLFTDVVSPP